MIQANILLPSGGKMRLLLDIPTGVGHRWRHDPEAGHTHLARGNSSKPQSFAAMFSGLAIEYDVLFYPAFDDAFLDDVQLKEVGDFKIRPVPKLPR